MFQTAGNLSMGLAAAKTLTPSELSQSYTPDASNKNAIPKIAAGGNDNDSDDDSAMPATPVTPNTSDDHIKVICRFRPKNNKERGEEKRQNLDDGLEVSVVDDEETTLDVPRKSRNKPKMTFTLDGIIWHTNNQEQTFNKLARPTVDSVIEGYNCTIFAFGQTGSGKSYTMFGPDNLAMVQELGIIPRSVDYMFRLLNDGKNIVKYQISLSICEVYKEMLRDLLTTDKKNRKRLEILSAGKDVTVKNLTERQCDNVGDILQYIVMAQANRAKHTTDFIGHESSRSHCVVMITVTQRLLDDTIKFSKLNFGDLAGSELAAKTGASGTNLKEAGKIHQGLLALENVINALVEKKKHVPYNDSKLTRLLSTSIGGNSKTTLLVTCSPSIWNRDETISTLRFAKRAKKIKNKAKINKHKTREQLSARIIFLEAENASLKQKLGNKFGGGKLQNGASKFANKSMGDLTAAATTATAGDDDSKSEERQNHEEAMRAKQEELSKLQQLLDTKDDQMKQLEEDLESKQEIVDVFDAEKQQLRQTVAKLSAENEQFSTQIEKLQSKLEQSVVLQNTFDSHTANLSSIVNDSVKDSSTAMSSALHEVAKQQADFFNFLKSMSSSIDKIYDKQVDSEREVNSRFDEVNTKLSGIGGGGGGGGGGLPGLNAPWSAFAGGQRQYNGPRPPSPSASDYGGGGGGGADDDNMSMLSTSEYDNNGGGGHSYQDSFMFDNNDDAHNRELSVASFAISPEQLGLEQAGAFDGGGDSKSRHGSKALNVNRGDAEVLTDLISSMKSYLDKTRTTDDKLDADKLSRIQSPFFHAEDLKMSEEDANSYQSNFSVGKKVDVLDVQYVWYTATIVDIDVFDKKAVYIKYDNFEQRWNEWVPLTKSHRIAQHTHRTCVVAENPGVKNEHGGVHTLLTTKFGKSKAAMELQEAFSSERRNGLSEKTILLQGHLYKRSNWNKKSWKRRWFVIRNNHNLYYYDHKNMKSKQYRGVIALSAISVVLIAKLKGYTQHSFNIRTQKNTKHRFSCANEADLTDWVTVLESLIWGDCDQINIIRPNQPKPINDNFNQQEEEDSSDEEQDTNSKSIALQPSTPQKQGSVNALANKWKQLTQRTSSSRAGPYVATIQQIE